MALYNPTIWTNGVTPVNKTNLEHLEQGIYTVSLDSVTSLVCSYSNDIFEIKIKNVAGTVLASYPVSIPIEGSINSITLSGTVLSIINNAGTTTTIDLNTLFYTKSQMDTSLANYYTKSQLYNKNEVDLCFTEVTISEE